MSASEREASPNSKAKESAESRLAQQRKMTCCPASYNARLSRDSKDSLWTLAPSRADRLSWKEVLFQNVMAESRCAPLTTCASVGRHSGCVPGVADRAPGRVCPGTAGSCVSGLSALGVPHFQGCGHLPFSMGTCPSDAPVPVALSWGSCPGLVDGSRKLLRERDAGRGGQGARRWCCICGAAGLGAGTVGLAVGVAVS